jgi:hypothetical protein
MRATANLISKIRKEKPDSGILPNEKETILLECYHMVLSFK